MNQRSLATLIAINAVLLVAVVVSVFSPAPAMAQFGGGNQYLMIAGQAPQRQNQSLVYVIDLRSSRIITVLYNSGNQRLELIAGRVVGDDLRAAPSGRR